MTTALAAIDAAALPSTQIGDAGIYDDLAQGAKYAKSLKLYTKGKAIDKGLIPPGRFGVYESAEKIVDLGPEIDVMAFARRPFAIDMSDKENLIRVYDPADPEFQRIRSESAVQNSGCQCGVEFLLFERSTGQFYAFFCGTKSTLKAAKDIYPNMPLGPEEAAVQGEEPRGPQPFTLKARFVETPKFTWHAPVVQTCSTPFNNLSDMDTIVDQVKSFLNPKATGAEVVPEDEAPSRDR